MLLGKFSLLQMDKNIKSMKPTGHNGKGRGGSLD